MLLRINVVCLKVDRGHAWATINQCKGRSMLTEGKGKATWRRSVIYIVIEHKHTTSPIKEGVYSARDLNSKPRLIAFERCQRQEVSWIYYPRFEFRTRINRIRKMLEAGGGARDPSDCKNLGNGRPAICQEEIISVSTHRKEWNGLVRTGSSKRRVNLVGMWEETW